MPVLILPAYQLSRDDLVLLNGEVVSDVLQVDTGLLTLVENTALPLALVPDSELVYGSAYAKFDIAAFVDQHNGPLKSYRETVEGQVLSGPQVVEYVARQYSVGPRVLLALLEYSGGWVTQPSPDWVASDFPVGHVNPQWRGLQAQLTWAANHLNFGYYGRKQRGVGAVRFADDTYTLVSPELNAGTVAVQIVLGLTRSYEGWKGAVSARGFLATYRTLFGDPFQYDTGSPLPADLEQPSLELPWAEGETWYYSGGPHGGWGGGSAWAAVDFVPPGTLSGCYDSDTWVRASANGLVVRSQLGMVVVDLDGDGLEQTGWVLNYAHIAARERVAYAGMRLKLGDPIGHPSCEGGVSTGTHVHFTRRYNGEWVMAGNGPVPMDLSGWTVRQGQTAYDGEMVKGERTLTAIAGRSHGNNDVTR
jgi:LasA protease